MRRIEEFGEEWAELLFESDDENGDTSTVAPANEEVLKSVDSEIEGPGQTSDLDAKLLKVTKELCRLQSEVNHLRKEVKNKHREMEVIETPTETPIKANPQGTTQEGCVSSSTETEVIVFLVTDKPNTRHLNVNDNDDENEDTWENRYYEDAWAYFNQAKIHTKFMKQLDSLDKRICKALSPPAAMVVDTIRHFATKARHPISSLEEIEEEYYGIGGWKEIASKLGPSTDYKDYEATYEALEDAFLLKVARLAEDSKRPLKRILHQLRRDLQRCHKPFATLKELTSFLDNAVRHAEAEPDAIYQQYLDMSNDFVSMREAYRNLRRGFTKYKCLAKSTREELETALSKIQESYDGDWATLTEEGRDKHLASMAHKALDPDNMHSLNGDFDYMNVWDSIGALMFFRQYQHLQAFIDQADECASYARDLFAVVDEEANAEADREEEAELHAAAA
ncbi:hypothetical protein D0863_01648 [Hortaea werneckii]|uniref:Uncharacterized protein n=1 Tax=Hortaea werneckii TaxID=91943 RepID=A0A3M7EK30_HORWE|nr:hypothetical protein D0863_01648 [Hortaea werneckii]